MTARDRRSEPAGDREIGRKAYELRMSVIDMIYHGGSGHPGGSLSLAEIVACLYCDVMWVEPGEPRHPWRDRLVLSKGHAAPIVYAALADRGFFPESELKTLRRTGSILQGHPCMNKTPGVDMTTGSLGQGLSSGLGMALGLRHRRAEADREARVYVLLSDGELQEGMIWEAAMAAAHYRCGNLKAVVDHNNLQVDGPVEEVMAIEPLRDKWASFGWRVFACDGHDVAALRRALAEMNAHTAGPAVLLAKTVKGKGVSFMENVMEWHASPISREIRDRALSELRAARDRLSG